MYLDEYKRWLAADLEDADLKPELAKVEGNDDEIKDRFAVALKFGTAGLRGVLGADIFADHRYTRTHEVMFYNTDAAGNPVGEGRSANNDNKSEDWNKRAYLINSQLMLDFDRTFGKHHVAALLGASNESYTSEANQISFKWADPDLGINGDGTEAVITDFFSAAFNPSIFARYTHTVDALLIMGAFVAMAVSAWYLIKNRHKEFAMKTMKLGAVVGIVVSCVMLVTAHSSAVTVAEEQPTKLAMMEGMYDSEVPPLYAFGWVDEENQKVITPFSIPGGTSFLATGTWDTEYEGLNQLAASAEYGALDPETAPVNFVFQTYHLMVAMYGLIMLTVILALVFTLRGGKIQNMKWLQRLVLISPVFPLIAIQAGWFTAEVGRQPWVVYPSATSPEPKTISPTLKPTTNARKPATGTRISSPNAVI